MERTRISNKGEGSADSESVLQTMIVHRWRRLGRWHSQYIFCAIAAVSLMAIPFINRKGIGMDIAIETHHVKTASPTATNTNRTKRKKIRFTQMWSTGHVGTRYLAGLLPAPWFFDKLDVVANSNSTRDWIGNSSSNYSKNYMVWNEHELPALVRKNRNSRSSSSSSSNKDSVDDLSLDEYKAMILARSLPGPKKNYVRNFNRFVQSHHYGGQQIKKWNRAGNRNALRDYLRDERVPALWSVYERYNIDLDSDSNSNSNDGDGDGEDQQKQKEQLTHFIKVGHTAVFFDLSDYYEILSSAGIDVDFVRIRRNRIDVANSFVGDWKRKGPVGYDSSEEGICTSPAMKTALLRFDSLEDGPLPEKTWWNWTIFQRYLWFCDEIEARWRVFLKKHPGVVYYELAYSDAVSAASDDPDASKSNPKPTKQVLAPSDIDDMALNFLDLGTPLSPYMEKIAKQSHLSASVGKVRNTKEQVRQALEYSKQAPWCLQYEGKDIGINSDLYPELDCGILA